MAQIGQAIGFGTGMPAFESGFWRVFRQPPGL